MAIGTQALYRLRKDTPGLEERIHFNNAGAALPPRPVVAAVEAHLQLEARIGGYEAARAARRQISQFYDAVGRLLNAPPKNIAFAFSATEAYNKALSAIPFSSGDTILTTDEDYVSNQIAFLQLQGRFGLKIVRAGNLPEGGVDPASVEQLIKKQAPRLVAVTHVPTSSGLVQDVEAVGQICREHSCLYLVDACQSAGQMPLDVQKIHCDFLSATARKFLRGPRGAGFLFVSPRVLEEDYVPLFLDLHSADWTAPDSYEAKPDARRFETWERSYALMEGTRVAAEYAIDIGLEAIWQRTRFLAEQLREQLADIKGVQVLDRGKEPCGIVTIHAAGQRPLTLQAALEREGLNTSVTGYSSAVIDFQRKGIEWALRLSPHYYNTEEEVQASVKLLKKVLGK